MVKKKHIYHCSKCGSPCTIYKKGKTHRLLSCPRCGILASNPLPLLALAASTLAPMAISAAKKRFTRKKTTDSDSPTQTEPRYQKRVFDSLDKPNKNERYIDLALRM